MKLAASNIAWGKENDEIMYLFLREQDFCGVEIAPTRIFEEAPYDQLEQAQEWSRELMETYGLCVPSIQSIWYGQKGNIFHEEEREDLEAYTLKAITFAQTIGAGNLVFGCPRARRIPEGMETQAAERVAENFFRSLGNSAAEHDTVLSLEANPVIYNTNFMNTTKEAVKMAERVGHEGCKVNLDLGTIIYNYRLDEEDADEAGAIEALKLAIPYAQHIHISEPGLKPIKARQIHKELFKLAKALEYQGYISIEMGNTQELQNIQDAVRYIRGLTK